MAQWICVLADLSEDTSVVPSAHIKQFTTARYSSCRGSNALFGFFRHLHTFEIYTKRNPYLTFLPETRQGLLLLVSTFMLGGVWAGIKVCDNFAFSTKPISPTLLKGCLMRPRTSSSTRKWTITTGELEAIISQVLLTNMQCFVLVHLFIFWRNLIP